MKKLKIAHLFQSTKLRYHEPQAAQLHIYHTIRGLQQAGHEALLVAVQNRQLICTDDLGVFKMPARNGHFGRLGMSDSTGFKLFESGVRRAQRTVQFPYLSLFDSYRMYDGSVQNLAGFDLLHERFNFASIGGAVARKKLGIPLVLEVNADLIAQRKMKGRPEKGLRLAYGKWATDYCFAAADKVVCISEGLAEHLRDAWKVPAFKLAVLPCAADIEKFNADHDTKAIRAELGLTNEPVIMWVGGFFDWHDLPLLLNSFRIVLNNEPRAKLVLVGDGDRRDWVEQTIAENNMGEAVILTGAVAHEKVPAFLAISDILVSPAVPVSPSEGGTGTPLKLFEYMAAGKPIVATAIRNATAVIDHKRNGYLVEAGDVAGFADGILTLLRDDTLRQQLAKNAGQIAKTEHSWEKYTEDLLKIYGEVLK